MSEEIEILIVEESVSQAEQLKHILEQHDHKVSIEHTARPALARIRQHKPQIVISAVMLPEMDGYALCREIKADEQLKDIPVILLTSLSDTTDIIRGMECGADNFVTKPYDEKLLMSRIEYIVLNRELRVGSDAQTGLELVFNGEKYSITPERQQIVDLLISTYETAVQKNLELVRVQQELNALNERLEEKIEERTIELKAEVAEHLAAKESLKEQQDFLSDVIDTNPNPVFVKDHEGRFTLANKAMAELYGTTTTAIIGKTDYDLNGKQEEVERTLRHDKAVIETAQRIYIPEEPITDQKTGEVSWFQTVRTPLVKPNGEVRQILGIATDITERRRAEQSQRDSEQRYRLLGEGIWHQVWTAQPDGKLDYVNGGTLKFSGRTEEQLLGEGWQDAVHPDDLPQCVERWTRSLQTGENYEVEFRLRGADEIYYWHLARATAGRDSTGKIIKWFGTNTEIDNQKRTEEALRVARSQLEATLEAGAIAIWDYDILNNRVVVDKKLAQLFSVSPEEAAVGALESYTRAMHSGDRQRVEQAIAEAVESRIKYEAEYRIVQPDGSVRWVMMRGQVERDAAGAAIRMSGVIIDTTERKLLEAERDAERKLLDALINQLPVGVLFRDLHGRHTRTNRAAAMLAHIERDKLSEMSAIEVVRAVRATHPDGSPLKEEDIPPITGQRGGRPVEPLEVLLNPVEGAARRATISIAPVALDGEEPFGSVVVINDVTEQYSLQEQLQQSQKMEAIGTLTGGVAHDFNNLLTVILGNTHLALRTLQSDNPLQLRLVEVEKAANRAAVLTRQLLAFSRRQHLERRSINLNDTISEIMKLLQRIIGEDVEVRVIATTGLCAVFADPTQLEQVIMNLAVNACDSMPAGGQLTIETSNITLDESYQRHYPDVTHGKYVQIAVSDTGTGIDAETQKHIFEPFFTTKEVSKGTGLGLSMVCGIVKQHDGHIHVYSEIGHGTTFKILLPIVESAVEKNAQPIQLPLLGGMETILVAEDEEPLRGLARDILEGLGYTVLLAKNGEEAVEKYEQNRERIDMLLLDVVMPRMSGWEAYERIYDLGGDVPLIFMTGYSSETVQSRFVKQNQSMEESGAVVLQKPYNVEGLGRKVREVLDTKRRK